MKNIIKKIKTALVLAAASVLTFQTLPMVPVMAETTYTCTVQYKADNQSTAISDAEFSFIQVAGPAAGAIEGSSSFNYVMNSDFKSSKYNPNDLTSSGDDAKTIATNLQAMYKSGATVKKTDSTGVCSFTVKEPGLYLVWQTGSSGTADNYYTSSPMIVFLPSVDSDGVTLKNTITIEPKTSKKPENPTEETTTSVGAISVYKVDADNQNAYLKGAEFSLYKSDGTLVGNYTTNDKGYFGVSSLAYGDYYLIETKAPDGYMGGSDKITFTLNSSTSYSNDYPWNIKVTNTKTTKTVQNVQNTPQEQDKKVTSKSTGDASNMTLWIIIGGVACAAAIGGVIVYKKKKN